MNGVPSGCVTVSTVTWRSSMHSRSADCVFGLARLISSPRTMLAKIAPGLNSKSPRAWTQTTTGEGSVGKRPGRVLSHHQPDSLSGDIQTLTKHFAVITKHEQRALDD